MTGSRSEREAEADEAEEPAPWSKPVGCVEYTLGFGLGRRAAWQVPSGPSQLRWEARIGVRRSKSAVHVKWNCARPTSHNLSSNKPTHPTQQEHHHLTATPDHEAHGRPCRRPRRVRPGEHPSRGPVGMLLPDSAAASVSIPFGSVKSGLRLLRAVSCACMLDACLWTLHTTLSTRSPNQLLNNFSPPPPHLTTRPSSCPAPSPRRS